MDLDLAPIHSFEEYCSQTRAARREGSSHTHGNRSPQACPLPSFDDLGLHRWTGTILPSHLYLPSSSKSRRGVTPTLPRPSRARREGSPFRRATQRYTGGASARRESSLKQQLLVTRAYRCEDSDRASRILPSIEEYADVSGHDPHGEGRSSSSADPLCGCAGDADETPTPLRAAYRAGGAEGGASPLPRLRELAAHTPASSKRKSAASDAGAADGGVRKRSRIAITDLIH
ncbi:uncharacterized protein SCHCODRAFT_02637983 [Schizophyllum commune H4-8]|uniref:Expressed protein n=1 Tax=Schizophyllum commune (strain H4-8 / FGSC 9210) TaxID=578458 RepID=D8QD43_SCHCM|nr:uncharacterized protein SCHCODRAFT_02637983 [Schizophyllum commune H4-8]KAI5888875.1 hypothetical protein SCHCODRAFT_02637983 [Schizophyllum commune H4-8]